MSLISKGAAILFGNDFKQKIGIINLDIVDNREVTESMTISKNPIEGSFNSDNIKKDPASIIISATISSYPIHLSPTERLKSVSFNGSLPKRLQEAHDELIRLKDEGEPIELVTKYKVYENMVIVSITHSENSSTGEAFVFDITFSEVNIVSSQNVTIENLRIKNLSAKKKTSFGESSGGDKAVASKPKITLWQFIKESFF